MPLPRTKKVPAKPLRGIAANNLNVAKDGDTVKLWLTIDGKNYEFSFVDTADAPSSGGSGGTTDHGALSGLTDDDHTQYVLRSIVTTKGDLFSYSTVVARLGVGNDNSQLLLPDSTQTVGLRWGNLVFNDDELISNDDEIVTI